MLSYAEQKVKGTDPLVHSHFKFLNVSEQMIS